MSYDDWKTESPEDERLRLGTDDIRSVPCEDCDGTGTIPHDCGEDSCCCLDDDDEDCPTCDGTGFVEAHDDGSDGEGGDDE